MDLLPFLLDANLSATNPPAIPHWWKRQPLIPTLLSQELKNFLKLNVKEKNIQIAGNDSNLLIVFYVQIMPDDFVMQLHRF